VLFALTSLFLVPISIVRPQQRVAHAIIAVADALLTLLIIHHGGAAAHAEAFVDEDPRIRSHRQQQHPRVADRAVRRQVRDTRVFCCARSKWMDRLGLVFPTATLALRLLLRQRIVLNAAMLAVVAATALLLPTSSKGKHGPGAYVVIGISNIFCFAIGALLSRAWDGRRSRKGRSGAPRRASSCDPRRASFCP